MLAGYIEDIGMKLVYLTGWENVLPDIVSRNIKERPAWRVVKWDFVEFNNLRYTENDIKIFQCADEVLGKLIEINKGNKAATNIVKNFSKHIHNIYHISYHIYHIYHIISIISYILCHSILYYYHYLL